MVASIGDDLRPHVREGRELSLLSSSQRIEDLWIPAGPVDSGA